jgi:hypothetical protein
MFCDTHCLFFCYINLLRFDLSVMYSRSKAKVARELVTYCEGTFKPGIVSYCQDVLEST